MRSRLAFGVATVFAALMVGGAEGGGDARPAAFAGNGTLVFSCVGCPGSGQGLGLFTITASGGGYRRLHMSAAEATRPRWSPDGRSVAFSSAGDLWRLAVRPAGRGLRLTRKCRACLGDDFPAWSPDGRKILFVRDGALFTIRALNGTRPRELKTWRPRFFNSPDWAPDGRRIAFQRSGSGIYVAGADGTRARRVGDQSLFGTHPRWSPDGKRIAFLGWRRGILSVLVVRADGRGLRVIARPDRLDPSVNPSWSPDGRHVLFVAKHLFDPDGELYGREFWVAPVAGGPLRRVAIPQLPRDRSVEIVGIDWTGSPAAVNR